MSKQDKNYSEETDLVLKNHLKDTRRELGLSQQQLADMIGVSRNTIGSIERCVFVP
ncbi:TPA: helix-turn-helix transcriptional regulator, partial [Enterococcus faecium]